MHAVHTVFLLSLSLLILWISPFQFLSLSSCLPLSPPSTCLPASVISVPVKGSPGLPSLSTVVGTAAAHSFLTASTFSWWHYMVPPPIAIVAWALQRHRGVKRREDGEPSCNLPQPFQSVLPWVALVPCDEWFHAALRIAASQYCCQGLNVYCWFIYSATNPHIFIYTLQSGYMPS